MDSGGFPTRSRCCGARCRAKTQPRWTGRPSKLTGPGSPARHEFSSYPDPHPPCLVAAHLGRGLYPSEAAVELYALGARQLGWARAAIIGMTALGALYVAVWAQVWLSRRRANAGRVKRFVISRASATALVRLAASGVGDFRPTGECSWAMFCDVTAMACYGFRRKN